MKLNSASLFLIPLLIWGSTFFVIKFQLGVVDPTWSVSYRFILSGILLLGYARYKSLPLHFELGQHKWMLIQGLLLFGFNYWLVYVAEQELVSGLVAVAFSAIIFLNILFGSIFLGRKSEKKVFAGAILGFGGTFLLFRNDLVGLEMSELPVFYLILCFSSVVIASLGNITSAYNQSKSLPVIQTNAFGMIYGGVAIGLIALLSGTPIVFDFSISYVGSLIYLAVFGSIIAFTSYLTLIGRIGADKAAYVLIVIPVIAIVFSMLFEEYSFNAWVILGITLILGGNLLVLTKK